MSEDARHRELVAKSIRIHGRIAINIRMVCREASFSPMTVYKRFPWLQELLSEADRDDAPPTVPAAVSEAQASAQQTAEIASLKKAASLLQTENHQPIQNDRICKRYI